MSWHVRATPKQHLASGEVNIVRSAPTLALVLLTLYWPMPGEAIAQSDKDHPTSQWTLVTGEELAHASGGSPTSQSSEATGEYIGHWSGLPFWGGEEAYERGFELPNPLGLSGNFYTEKQDVSMEGLKLGGPCRLFDVSNLIRVSDIETEQSVWNTRFDSWVLPFLNLSAILGYVDGQADMKVGPGFGPLGGRFAPNVDISLEYEGPVMGLGGTVAAGFKPFKGRDTILFGQSDLNFNWTFLDFDQLIDSLDTVTVIVFSTRIGVRERVVKDSSIGDVHVSLWGGAMFQHIQRHMTGDLGILNLNLNAEIEALAPWNPLVGGRVEIGKNFDLMVEVGMGGRQSLLIGATVRF